MTFGQAVELRQRHRCGIRFAGASHPMRDAPGTRAGPRGIDARAGLHSGECDVTVLLEWRDDERERETGSRGATWFHRVIVPTASGLHVDVHLGGGPAILMVHGFLAGRALWRANLEALRAVATPVVVELYGHGRSPSPLDPLAYHPDSYVAAFEEIRRELGVDRWFVLGHSLGAALTLRYVLDHPDRVIAHLFTNSASALAGPEWRDAMVTNADAEADRILKHGLAHLERSSANPARSHRIVAAVREALTADVPLLQRRGVSGTIRHTAPASTVRARIGGNTRPTLLVAGRREQVFAEPCHYVEAAMPNLTVMRVDAGHSPNAETPEAFNDAAVSFITDTLT